MMDIQTPITQYAYAINVQYTTEKYAFGKPVLLCKREEIHYNMMVLCEA